MPPSPRGAHPPLTTVVYDLRTPLTVLRGRLQLLSRYLAVHPQPAQAHLLTELSTMQQQVNELSHRLDVVEVDGSSRQP
jgi:K+-sensing histidine kinase KdpD